MFKEESPWLEEKNRLKEEEDGEEKFYEATTDSNLAAPASNLLYPNKCVQDFI